MSDGFAIFWSVKLYPRTFAPVWEVFKSSTEKLASCHMELVRKLQELIKEVQKYVEEQAKAHKKVRRNMENCSIQAVSVWYRVNVMNVMLWYLNLKKLK